jgi:hypothetical protein
LPEGTIIKDRVVINLPKNEVREYKKIIEEFESALEFGNNRARKAKE